MSIVRWGRKRPQPLNPEFFPFFMITYILNCHQNIQHCQGSENATKNFVPSPLVAKILRNPDTCMHTLIDYLKKVKGEMNGVRDTEKHTFMTHLFTFETMWTILSHVLIRTQLVRWGPFRPQFRR